MSDGAFLEKMDRLFERASTTNIDIAFTSALRRHWLEIRAVVKTTKAEHSHEQPGDCHRPACKALDALDKKAEGL